MSFNPMDIMRTHEASTYRQMEISRAQHAQEHIDKNFQTLIEREQKKPKETTKADNPEYRYDAKEKGNSQYYSSGDKKKEKKEEKKKDEKKTPSTGGFDMRV